MNLQSLDDGSELDFSNIHIFDANLEEANLSGATLSNATFENSSFRNSDLSRISGQGVKLENCDLTGATLSKADFSSFQTDCSGSTFVQVRCNKTDFQQADLSRTNFSGARITNAFLQGSNLSRSEFVNTTLRNTKVFWSNISHCDFSDSKIENCDLTGVDAEKVAFYDAIITKTQFVDSQLAKSSFTGADLTDSVDFGHRLIQEYNADRLAGDEELQAEFDISVENQYGRKAMKEAMGDDNWYDPDVIACKEPSESEIQELYASSSGLTGFNSGLRKYMRRVQFRRIRRRLPGGSDSDGEVSKSHGEVECLETAETIYAKIEAAYSGTAWHDERRRFGTRKNEVRRKMVNRSYPRQVFSKWSMGYGERPQYVLGVTIFIAFVAAFLLPIFGVQINGTKIHYDIPNNFLASLGYSFELLKFTFYTLVGVSSTEVTPIKLGSAIEFGLTVAGQLLFALFVYTLGRRAVA